MSKKKVKVFLTRTKEQAKGNICRITGGKLAITKTGIAVMQQALVLCEPYLETPKQEDIIFYDRKENINILGGVYYIDNICQDSGFITCTSAEIPHTEIISMRDENLYRVVASSDVSLNYQNTNLPIISHSFVQKYVEKQGDIKEVMIEKTSLKTNAWDDILIRPSGTVILSPVKEQWRLIVITIIKNNEIVTNNYRTCDNSYEEELWLDIFDGTNVRIASTGDNRSTTPWYSQTGIHIDGTIRTFSSVSFE